MKKIVKSALLVVVMMLISKVLGLLREIFLAQQFGTSYIVDAYTVACTLPTVLFTLFASGFSNSYLPVYMRINEPEKKNFFFNNLTSLYNMKMNKLYHSVLKLIYFFRISNKNSVLRAFFRTFMVTKGFCPSITLTPRVG